MTVKLVLECRHPDTAAFLLLLHAVFEDGPRSRVAGDMELAKFLPSVIWFLHDQVAARVEDGCWLSGEAADPDGVLFEFDKTEWAIVQNFLKGRYVPKEA